MRVTPGSGHQRNLPMSGTSIAEEGTQSRDCSHVDVRLQRILRSWFLFFIIPTEFLPYLMCLVGFPGGSDGKASVCNAGDLGLIPGSGRSPGKDMATNSSTLAWKIPWTEDPGRLQSMGSQKVGT